MQHVVYRLMSTMNAFIVVVVVSAVVIIIVPMDICRAPTLRLKALNKHSITHIMYIEMENVISNKKIKNKNKKFFCFCF